MSVNLEADRRSLIARLVETQECFARLRTSPAIVKADVVNAAFNAVADCGIFSRRHPEMRIEPVRITA